MNFAIQPESNCLFLNHIANRESTNQCLSVRLWDFAFGIADSENVGVRVARPVPSHKRGLLIFIKRTAS